MPNDDFIHQILDGVDGNGRMCEIFKLDWLNEVMRK